jgi:hypothetical protein
MFKCPPQGALRAPCKVRLAPHRLMRALRARKSARSLFVAAAAARVRSEKPAS